MGERIFRCGWFQAALCIFLNAPARAADVPKPIAEWRIDLVAKAPAIRHPSVVCAAPDGKIFVAEDPMDITAPANTNQGRILCFHPDGRRTVFAERLYAVFGMQYLEGRIYVLHNPKFSVFTDVDGVGRDREDLIASMQPNPWALNWNDHVPANFRLAMDGYFYLAAGDKGVFGAMGRDGKRADLHGGGILRLRPSGTGLEVYSTGVRNILDVALNSEDDLFTYDNTDEHDWMGRLTHMVEAGFYGYPYDFVPRRPYTLWMMHDFGGGAATGAFAYNEDALPSDYYGNLFLADFGKRQLLRVKLARDGATYRVASHQEMFVNPPKDFRPVGITLAPDGRSIYICDWNHRDTREQAEVGRLWKLGYTGKTKGVAKPSWYLPAAMGEPFEATATELIAGLSHPSKDVRLTAQRRLSDRKEATLLAKVLRDTSLSPAARWHAIWGLDAINGGKAARQTIITAAKDPDRTVRRQAVRQLGLRRVAEAMPLLRASLQDEDACVRFEAATSLGRIADPDASGALVRALADKDPFVYYATFTALNQIIRKHHAPRELIGSALQSREPAIRAGAEFAFRETYDESLLALLTRLVQKPATSEPALRLIAGLHHKAPVWNGEWWAYHPALAPPPVKNVEWAGTKTVLAVLREHVAATNAGLRKVAIDGLKDARATNAASVLREQAPREADPELRRKIIEVLGEFNDRAFSPFLARLLRDKSVDQPTTVTGIRAAARIATPELKSAILEFLNSGSFALQREAIRILGQSKDRNALASLRPLLAGNSAELRREVVTAIGNLRTRDAVPDLLAAWKSPDTKTNALAALAQLNDLRALDAYLEGLASPNAMVRDACRKALVPLRDKALPILESQTAALSSQVIGELKRLYSDHPAAKTSALFSKAPAMLEASDYERYALARAGDSLRGGRIFFDENGVACIKCHSIEGRGGAAGPDLTLIGSQFPRAALIEHLLYPSRVVREGYQQFLIETRDNDTISGLIKSENADTLTLVTADARVQTVPKNNILNRSSSNLSLMPEGLQAGLTLDQFADLIAYLESRKADARKERP